MSYTLEQYEKKLNEIGPVKLLEFNGVLKPIKYQCCVCKKIYTRAKADGILANKSLCHNCFHHSKDDIEKIKDTFINKVINKFGNNIEIMQFTSTTEPLVYKCLNCGKIHELQTARQLLRNNRYCVNCQLREQSKEILKKLQKIENKNNLEVVSLIINTDRCRVICRNCGRMMNKSRYDIDEDTSCKFCEGREVPYDTFLEKLNEIKQDSYEILDASDYHGLRNSRILVRHNCGFIRSVSPENLLKYNCPKCSKKVSKGEQKILNWLNNNNILYKFQFSQRIDNKTYYFDFYLPEYNLFIEYDGIQHFEEVDFWGGKDGLEQRQMNDKTKNDWCNKNNKNLLRITYLQFDSIDSILESSTTNLVSSEMK